MSVGARVLLGIALSAGVAGVCAAVATGHLRFPGDEPGALAGLPDASQLRGDPIAGVAARPAAAAAAPAAAVTAGPTAAGELGSSRTAPARTAASGAEGAAEGAAIGGSPAAPGAAEEPKGALVAPPPTPPAAPAAGPPPAEAAPAAVAPAAPAEQPVAPRPVDGDGYTTLSFAELSDFQFWAPDPYGTPEEIRAAMERLQQIPEDIRALDGKRVSVRGTMSPIDVDRRGVKRFMLVAYQTGCCFGMAIRLNEQIMVSMPGDERAEYVVYDDITVSGTLQVGAQFEDGWVTSLYRMVADEVVVEDG
jgi:hypothetical protein